MKLPDLPHGVAVLTPRRTLPRRGLADPGWVYVPADQTDIAKTIRAERARIAAQSDALEERAAVRAVISELHAGTADVLLPMPSARSSAGRLVVDEWMHAGAGVWTPHRSRLQTGRLDPDTAVALAALALLGAACCFAGLFS